MILVMYLTIFLTGMCSSQYYNNLHTPLSQGTVSVPSDELANFDMVMTFVVFRHGDRTPDQGELDKIHTLQFDKDVFFPYGKQALTNKGKQRAFRVGLYLRDRYDGLVSKLYLPEEIRIQTTDYARTKMTALAALSALYPPPTEQRWNLDLNWQPIPYDTPPRDDDSLLHFLNCQRYWQLKGEINDIPEVRAQVHAYADLFKTFTSETGYNITTLDDVFDLDNLFQTLSNVNVPIPQWAQEAMPIIKEITKIKYGLQYSTNESIRISAGGLLTDILEATKAKIGGDNSQPKLFMYSAHENNVASLLALARAFKPHQPNYGSAASLELWRNRVTGKYGFMVVYVADAGGPAVVLPVEGCGGEYMCDYHTFLNLTSDYAVPHSQYKKHCAISS